ncbi:hypothetical protein EGI31_22130 [Lacihabitans soyangensis]|uniref:Uncharacterized protein n=1 Tax=Lacihabitans soyangensis TaxID=869394 RepID=A0AAE3H694_9BACT|nr:hypothetical protein [Lacihabitans soyangensis]
MNDQKQFMFTIITEVYSWLIQFNSRLQAKSTPTVVRELKKTATLEQNAHIESCYRLTERVICQQDQYIDLWVKQILFYYRYIKIIIHIQ